MLDDSTLKLALHKALWEQNSPACGQRGLSARLCAHSAYLEQATCLQLRPTNRHWPAALYDLNLLAAIFHARIIRTQSAEGRERGEFGGFQPWPAA